MLLVVDHAGVRVVFSIPVCSGLFISEDVGILRTLTNEARAGVTVQISSATRALAAKIRNAAAQPPVLHIRKIEDGDMTSTYLESLSRVFGSPGLNRGLISPLYVEIH